MSDLRRATERIEREEFARGHIRPGERPTVPRPASTIVVAWSPPRGGPDQVLLLRRPETSRFAAGAYVFAGGVIDAADGSAEARALLPEVLREPEPAAAVAALREMFEETGILPSDEPVDARAAATARARLLAGEWDFAEAASHLADISRALKLKAGYFVAYYNRALVWQKRENWARALKDELDGYEWIRPAEAVRRFAADELPMLFPTRRTLQDLTEEPDLGGLLERLRGRVPRPIEPRLLVRGDTVRPVLPGDPGFDEAG